MIAVATRGRAPYRQVVTNGWTLDENGEAFSKSKGNGSTRCRGGKIRRGNRAVVVASQNFMEDTRCGDNLLKQVSEMYRRIRNTFRFLLNNLYDFDPATHAVPYDQMEELDRWIVNKLGQLVQTTTAAYEVYEFHRVYQATLNFCSVELSAFYLDVLKDRLYASGTNWQARRSAQTALHTLAATLARMLAPILPHTAEEVWDYLKLSDKAESIHLTEFPTVQAPDAALLARWEPVLELRETVKKAIEEARQAGTIGNPLESQVELHTDTATYEALTPFAGLLPTVLLVSQAHLRHDDTAGTRIVVLPADGVKCGRCWLFKMDVGVNAAYPELCGRCAEAIA